GTRAGGRAAALPPRGGRAPGQTRRAEGEAADGERDACPLSRAVRGGAGLRARRIALPAARAEAEGLRGGDPDHDHGRRRLSPARSVLREGRGPRARGQGRRNEADGPGKGPERSARRADACDVHVSRRPGAREAWRAGARGSEAGGRTAQQGGPLVKSSVTLVTLGGLCAVLTACGGSPPTPPPSATTPPATSAPATSTPATSTPATSTPATSTPATSTPATSAPAPVASLRPDQSGQPARAGQPAPLVPAAPTVAAAEVPKYLDKGRKDPFTEVQLSATTGGLSVATTKLTG